MRIEVRQRSSLTGVTATDESEESTQDLSAASRSGAERCQLMTAPAGRSYIIYSRDRVAAGELEQRRHVLFTMLTALDYRSTRPAGSRLA